MCDYETMRLSRADLYALEMRPLLLRRNGTFSTPRDNVSSMDPSGKWNSQAAQMSAIGSVIQSRSFTDNDGINAGC